MKSTFPVAVGANITGVDAHTYGITGEPFSTISLPEQSSETATILQKDPVDLAYEFARKFPLRLRSFRTASRCARRNTLLASWGDTCAVSPSMSGPHRLCPRER